MHRHMFQACVQPTTACTPSTYAKTSSKPGQFRSPFHDPPGACSQTRNSHRELHSASATIAERGFSLSTARDHELLNLIDAQPPYRQLRNVQVLSDIADPSITSYSRYSAVVCAPFQRETALGRETMGPMTFAEIARHAAVLGSVACALHNPVKQRHHYLAFRGDQEVLNTISPLSASGETLACSSPVQMEARLLTIGKTHASVQVHTFCSMANVPSHQSKQGRKGPICCIQSPLHVMHSKSKIQYRILPVEDFNQQFGIDANASQGYASTFAADQHPRELLCPTATALNDGAYATCNHLVNITAHSDDVWMAELPFKEAEIAAGHFPHRPALPVALTLGNAIQLLSRFIPEGEPLLVRSAKMSCYRLVMLGESLRLVAQRGSSSQFVVTAVDENGKTVASMSFLLQDV